MSGERGWPVLDTCEDSCGPGNRSSPHHLLHTRRSHFHSLALLPQKSPTRWWGPPFGAVPTYSGSSPQSISPDSRNYWAPIQTAVLSTPSVSACGRASGRGQTRLKSPWRSHGTTANLGSGRTRSGRSCSRCVERRKRLVDSHRHLAQVSFQGWCADPSSRFRSQVPTRCALSLTIALELIL